MRIMSAMHQDSLWEKTKKGSKIGFDKAFAVIDKLGAPVNKLSNKLGSEAFWPTNLARESDKAARILRSFCKDGFYAEEDVKPVDGPAQKQRVLKKIPQQVIENAVGLCIFTTMRSGLWVSGSGGSGVLVARLEDGSWSPPSGILMHTAGVGFLAGIDIYDCVIVINTRKALESFTKVRVTLGGEVSAAAGPVGVGGILDSEVHARQAPLFTYIKSRGLYAGVQFDGTIVIERVDENARFYGQKISAREIVAGKVAHPPFEVRKLQETLRSAEGKEADASLIPDEKAPGDYEIEQTTHVFGVPDQEDPDPYGVHALEKEGMNIRKAGSREEAPEQEFEFHPTTTSPVNTSFQPAIEKARDRRNTLNSHAAPDVGSILASHQTVTDNAVVTPAIVPPRGPPPTLPSRDAVATSEDGPGADIATVRPDEEHFETPAAVTPPAIPPKIELRDEEATAESDIAALTLDESRKTKV